MSTSTPHEGLFSRFLEETGAHIFIETDPEYNIVDVGPNFLRLIMRNREDVIGKHLFDVFPDNPKQPNATGVRNLRGSIERVRNTLETDKMASQRYDVQDPTGEWVERWWRAATVPVFDRAGNLKYIVIRIEDTTQEMRLARRLRSTEIRNYTLYALVLVLFGLLTFFYTNSNDRLTQFEHQTCQIQQHSLPASHQLTFIMSDIHKLLLPHTPGEKKRLKASPKVEQDVVRNLNRHLTRYLYFIGLEPNTRKC